ncbi:MAG: NADH-quinone oxidoreductase subunit C, partial [Actinobacteria bacterium]|nr:NADH-quinone oxidoreductase subunit C [Actinomycetota bacterium]
MTQAAGASADDVRFVAKADYLKTLTALRSEGFEMCADLTAVDFL